jgi:HAE1 family hydrophobic/amphiphilic exporter-1
MFSRFFIHRPIFAIVIAIVMLIAGGMASYVIPVEQYPEIAPPVVQVKATYPGANAATIAATVAAPIEQEVNGVENAIYMSSVSADDGTYTLDISFDLGTDPDIAAVQVQNRVSTAMPKLPSEVRAQGITTKKRSPSLLMVLMPYSPNGTHSYLTLSNYVTLNMKDPLARTPGVGDLFIFGDREYSMRIWLDPDLLTARGLTTLDVIDALQEQNVQVAAGRIGAEPSDDKDGFQLTINTKGRLTETEEFGDIILKVGEDQQTLRLKDVARIELNAKNFDLTTAYNGQKCPGIGIYQLPGSNALEVADAVAATLAQLEADFPEDMECPVVYDFTRFVRASIEEVITTLIIASVLVFLTVFVFLQDWRATLVPGAAIPVSIIFTFAILLAMGYSMNMLTLLGLVLAIGIVVDDAIVVVENTKRIIDDEGLPAREATAKSMVEITGPVIATTLVLLAVFLPTTVLPGITGQLFRQFGVTLSVACVISSINALTLSPALCGLLLKPTKERRNILFRAFDGAISGSRAAYMGVVRVVMRVSIVAVVAFVAILGGAGYMFKLVPGGFLPNDDQAYFFINVQLPDAAKLGRTEVVLERIERVLERTEGVESVMTIGGYSLLTSAAQSNSGSFIVVLDPWEERPGAEMSADAIARRVSDEISGYPDAVCFAFLPPPIQGIGTAGGFDLRLQDRQAMGYDVLQDFARDLSANANATGQVDNVYSTFSAETPQLFLDIDRTKAKRLGIPLTTIFNTLQTNLGSSYVNDFNLFGRTYQVRVQGDARFRQSIDDILRLEVRNNEGRRVPLSTVMGVREVAGPAVVYRYNLYSAASLTGSPAPGRSSGQGLDTMEAVAAQSLPPGFGYEWTTMAYQEKKAGNLAPIAFAMALVFVYLFLAAQYESWSVPLTVMATIPIGVLGALVFTYLDGLDNNTYTQIGIVLLFALVCKNAILICEFAEQNRKEGMPLREATLKAADLRYRPILMTAFSFVLGTLPLLVATGAGASSRVAIGTAVFWGMVVATVVGIFFIPVMYSVVVSSASFLARLLGTGGGPPHEAPRPAADAPPA